MYSHGEILILVSLWHLGVPVVPSDIAKKATMSTARVTAILNNLEEKGFITREIDKADRRKILVSITALGKENAILAKQETLAQVEEIFKEMGEKDAQEFIRLLQAFFDIGHKVKEKGELNV